jgi:hypothetical protein
MRSSGPPTVQTTSLDCDFRNDLDFIVAAKKTAKIGLTVTSSEIKDEAKMFSHNIILTIRYNFLCNELRNRASHPTSLLFELDQPCPYSLLPEVLTANTDIPSWCSFRAMGATKCSRRAKSTCTRAGVGSATPSRASTASFRFREVRTCEGREAGKTLVARGWRSDSNRPAIRRGSNHKTVLIKL